MMEDSKKIEEHFKGVTDLLNNTAFQLTNMIKGMTPKTASRKVVIGKAKAMAHHTTDNRVIIEFENPVEADIYFKNLGLVQEGFSVKKFITNLFKRK